MTHFFFVANTTATATAAMTPTTASRVISCHKVTIPSGIAGR